MLRVLGLLVLCLPSQGGTAQEPLTGFWLSRLDDLARDARSGTFGPVGDRLWATTMEAAPGFRGQGHYLHHGPILEDPLVVEFADAEGRPLPAEMRSQRWMPTHSEVVWAVGGTTVTEHRWITRDDVFVSRFTVEGPADLGVRWSSPLANRPVGDPERFHVAALAGAANADLLRHPALRRGGPEAAVFVEGEAYLRQVGSRGRDAKAAASGGEVLGSDFGAASGHEAAWQVLSTGQGEWTLVARYARAFEGTARFSVRVAGSDAGTLVFSSTGGWGGRPEDFALASLDLGELPAGLVEVSITALGEGANTNIDGLFLRPTARSSEPLPPVDQWRGLDPLRGGLLLSGGRAYVDGVPFHILPPGGPQGVGPDRRLAVAGRGGRLHLLVVPVATSTEEATPTVVCAGVRHPVVDTGRSLPDLLLSLDVPPDGELEIDFEDCVLVAATREELDANGVDARRGEGEWHGVRSDILAAVHGLDDPRRVRVAAGAELVFSATLELSGSRIPGVATASALRGDDPLAEHRRQEASWYAAHAPRLFIDDELLTSLWTYRWFLVRHNLARPGAGYLAGGPVVYEGRHGGWYPRVITFSAPHIMAEARWLGDVELTLGNLRAHLHNQQADGVLPNLLADWRGFRYIQWIPEAAVEACKVHGDLEALESLLPGLLANVEGNLRRFDPDGDGALSPGDHYTTGMEFQPSFWFHAGYDNTQPQTELERPDFTAYFYGNCRALAEACAMLGRAEDAARMLVLADKARAGALGVLWRDAQDGFFYSVREADDDPALCKEVIGFYPFRFRLPPDEPRYLQALAALVDPEQFWSEYPLATCSKRVPVYSPAVQSWPGPGGLVQPCMWNGQTWPHANSLIADTMAVVLRHYGESAITGAVLGDFLRRYARFHCERGDPAKPLLREYGNGETGENWGCPDYMHSTFNDLLIRHMGGLVPRFDEALEVRPLPLGWGDFRLEDVPYHGRRVGIAVTDGRLTVTVDGETVGEGAAAEGLLLHDVLR